MKILSGLEVRQLLEPRLAKASLTVGTGRAVPLFPVLDAVICGSLLPKILVALLVIAASTSIVGTLSSQSAPVTNSAGTLTTRVDQLFVPWDRSDSPGCALAIIQDGRVIYQRGYGMANLDYNLPITPSSVFNVGSMGKQFTAMAVALLADERKLSLDDEIHKYLPDMPKYRHPITIRHLIHHTSGIRDYGAVQGLINARRFDTFSNDDIRGLLVRIKGLNFRPGDEHLYSNSGYFLLARIVEAVSGMSFPQFALERIFKPLGMKHTQFLDSTGIPLPYRVTAYNSGPKGNYTVSNGFSNAGPGSLWTTVEDLILWDQNFYEPKVGSKALIEQLVTPGKLNSGESIDYAFGLFVNEYKGLRKVNHQGDTGGFHTELLRFPNEQFSVVCLCNSTPSAGNLAKQVADLYLAHRYPTPAAAAGNEAPSNFIELPPKELAARTGRYRNVTPGDSPSLLGISLKEGRLIVDAEGDVFPIAALSQTRFRSQGLPFMIDFEFSQPPEQHSWTLQLKVGSQQKLHRLRRLAEQWLNEKQLRHLTGTYYAQEFLARYEIVLEGSTLYLRRDGARASALEPVSQDEFLAHDPFISFIRFVRNKQQRVNGFIVDAGRARDVPFDKR